MRTFATEAEFSGAIDVALKGGAGADDVRAALTAGIQQGEVALGDETPAADGTLNLRVKGFVLRDQDMPVAELIGVVGAAIGAAVVPGAMVALVIGTALTSFAALAWKAWRKGARLSRPQLAVLGLLEVHGPMEVNDLKRVAAEGVDGLTPTDIERAIKSLQEVELRDGDIVALVRQDSSGLWRAKPV